MGTHGWSWRDCCWSLRVSRLIIVTMPACCPSWKTIGSAFSDLSNAQVRLPAQVRGHQGRPALIGLSDAASGRRSPIAAGPARMRERSRHLLAITFVNKPRSPQATHRARRCGILLLAVGSWQSLNPPFATQPRIHTVTQCAASGRQLKRCSELDTERWRSLNKHAKTPTLEL